MSDFTELSADSDGIVAPHEVACSAALLKGVWDSVANAIGILPPDLVCGIGSLMELECRRPIAASTGFQTY